MSDPQRDLYTVSRLNRTARDLLERGLPLLWVEGEISNLARPASGHWYFTLKDSAAQVRCAMFRNRNQLARFRPQDGGQVVVRGRIGLYEPRGDYQFIVEHMEEAGDGALRRAFDELKARLGAEGLFAPEHKRPLPSRPRAIGVVTSPSGAAIRDILSVLKRRFPAAAVRIYPTAVQGDGAPAEIATAIRLAEQRDECDVLIVGRGGGSMEDLWAFNDERVARALFACRLPVVSAVGHEIDFTIADFVADLRAPTPSAAAELLTPDRGELLQGLMRDRMRLTGALRAGLQRRGERVAWLLKRLEQQHPGQRLRQRAQRLDELESRLQRALHHLLRHRRARLVELHSHLHRHLPLHRVESLGRRQGELHLRLGAVLERSMERRRTRLRELARALHAVSPLATLGRGYAIVSDGEGRVIRGPEEVRVGDAITARLARGHLTCRVEALGDD